MNIPDPILDAREEKLIEELKQEWENFSEPGIITRALGEGWDYIKTGYKKLPESIQESVRNIKNDASVKAEEAFEKASQREVILKALEFGKWATKKTSALTLSKENIIRKYEKRNLDVERFQEITTLRSYNIEEISSNLEWKDIVSAAAEGGITGAFGAPAIPVNLATLAFLLFRATQSTALYYGYDAKNNPREQKFAVQTVMQSLSANPEPSSDAMEYLLKVGALGQLEGLKHALSRETFKEMAEKGGARVMYLQLRAIGHKSAQKALESAGQKGIQVQFIRDILRSLAKNAQKEATKKSIPIIGGLIGAVFDGVLMKHVLHGSRLIYHKRFLVEKKERCNILKNPDEAPPLEPDSH